MCSTSSMELLMVIWLPMKATLHLFVFSLFPFLKLSPKPLFKRRNENCKKLNEAILAPLIFFSQYVHESLYIHTCAYRVWGGFLLFCSGFIPNCAQGSLLGDWGWGLCNSQDTTEVCGMHARQVLYLSGFLFLI